MAKFLGIHLFAALQYFFMTIVMTLLRKLGHGKNTAAVVKTRNKF